jgi:hypothetical protein
MDSHLLRHSYPLEEFVTTLTYLTLSTLRQDQFLLPKIIRANREVIVCVKLCYHTSPYVFYPTIYLPTLTYLLTTRMSVELTKLEKSIEEVLKKFMADKAMSEGVQASSTKGL